MHLDCPRFPSILAKGVIMVEWKDPEPTTSELLANAARELRANPGRWGIIKHSNSTLTYALRKGRYVAFRPATDWEFAERHAQNGGIDTYARFVGGG